MATIQPTEENNHFTCPLKEFSWLLDLLTQNKELNAQLDEPLFHQNPANQILVNEYVGNQKISSHFDDFEAFGDTIVTLSLISPIWLTLKKPKEIKNTCQEIEKETRILLESNSLFIMRKEARFRWRHGISPRRFQDLPDQKPMKRDESYRRVSLTVRELLFGRKKVAKEDHQKYVVEDW